MSRSQLPLPIKTAFSLNFHISCETSVLLHKNFGKLLENVMIVLCKEVVLKYEYVSCQSSDRQVKPSANRDLY